MNLIETAFKKDDMLINIKKFLTGKHLDDFSIFKKINESVFS